MQNVPEKYKVDMKVTLKDFIPKDLKPEQKKRIRETVKTVYLSYQIAGEEIPSVMNDDYRCQVIQIYDMELASMKDAVFIANLYQSLIKPLCVIKLHDSMDELYSFAMKRLNQQDESQIVLEYSVMTEKYPVGLPDRSRDRFLSYIQFDSIKNKRDKVCMYRELFTKAYLISNERTYNKTENILNGNVWYDTDKTVRMLADYRGLVDKRASLSKAVTNAEKATINHEIRENIEILDKEQY